MGLLAAWMETVPGYMDAEYYYGNALRLVDGKGWTETILWNYLDNPAGIPHPAHIYWMPLASFLAVPGMFLLNTRHFYAARLLMIFLAALIAPLTALLSFRLFKSQKYAVLSGFLALFPGFYLVYTTDIETYTPYLLLGGLVLLIAFGRESNLKMRDVFLLGIVTGLMHLARADGVLWLIGVTALILWMGAFNKAGSRNAFYWTAARVLMLALGYGVMMSPWFLRNFILFDNIFPPGTTRALWLTRYNQLFSYPADQLTFQSWAGSGWQSIGQVRLNAILENLKTLLGVQGEVILLPFMLVGIYLMRHKRWVVFTALMWGVTLLVMSFIFPLAGSRGGYFHSGSAVQIFLWILAPPGLDEFVRWGGRARNWKRAEAWNVFSAGLAVILAVMTISIYWQFVIGPDLNNPVWAAESRQAKQIEQKLLDLQIDKNETIMINNPPGYFTATDRAAIVIPDGSLQTSLEVAKRYQVKYLVLEKAHVDGLDLLYQNPQMAPQFHLLGQINDALIFRMGP